MADVLLIRHGQASFGEADYDRLSGVGEEQSRRLGAWLKNAGPSPELVATGRMQRHLRTAELCLQAAGANVPTTVLAGLDEMDHEEILARHRPDLVEPGALVAELARSDDPHRTFQHLYAAAATRWIGGAYDGEYACTWNAFRDNVLEGLRALAEHEARTIWAFTSGGPIAVIVNALVGAPIEQTFTLAWPLVNTSITRIRLDARRGQLVSYNAWPHLESVGGQELVTHR
jgi:broad specificity phosphatase PhoE